MIDNSGPSWRDIATWLCITFGAMYFLICKLFNVIYPKGLKETFISAIKDMINDELRTIRHDLKEVKDKKDSASLCVMDLLEGLYQEKEQKQMFDQIIKRHKISLENDR